MAANANQELQRYEIANFLYDSLYTDFLNEGQFLQYAGKSYSQNRQFYKSSRMLERALLFGADPTMFTTLGKDYSLFSKVDPQKKDRAEFLLTRAKYISPYKYYPRYLLAKYFDKTGKPIKAMEEAEALLTIKPKVSSPATDEIREELTDMIINQENVTPKVLFSGEEE